MDDTLFHQGETALQDRVGSKERLSFAAKLIRPALSETHQAFFSALPWVLLGGHGPDGQLWASLRYGEPGFIQVLTPNLLHLTGHAPPDDPLGKSWQPGQPIALLGFAAHIRRRNRANGIIREITQDGLILSVQQSYGNCNKYIRPRFTSLLSPQDVALNAAEAWAPFEEKALFPAARAIIARADTLFIASAHPDGTSPQSRAEGADISHRGGPSGFVSIQNDTCLILPDYIGNYYFNTLGNIILNPQVALLFIEYETARLLWIRANAELVDTPQRNAEFAGAERLLVLHVTACRLAQTPVPLRWQAATEAYSTPPYIHDP